jgi:hypothetical protein
MFFVGALAMVLANGAEARPRQTGVLERIVAALEKR